MDAIQGLHRGAEVGMLTHRRDSTTGTQEGGRSKQAERKPMWIALRVEETSFHPFSDNLRLQGLIVEGPVDIGSYHTHTIEIGSEIEISREGDRAARLRPDQFCRTRGKQTASRPNRG